VALAALSTSLVDGGMFLGPRRRRRAGVARVAVEPAAAGGLLFGALVALPVTLALWFAPALVVFQDVGPGVALGASLRAALANWRPWWSTRPAC